MFMDSKGWFAAEYVMLAGFVFLIACSMAFFIGKTNELNQAMAAARTGALEGAVADSIAVYPDVTFKSYLSNHTDLLLPSSVKIIKVDYEDQGFNSTYNRTKIKLIIHATSPSIKLEDRNYVGERINFGARKSICEVFKTQNLTNSMFNPAYSDRYVFTTGWVVWE